MKYWKDIIKANLSFEEAIQETKKCKLYYMTRHKYRGVTFYDKYNNYCVLLRDGTVIKGEIYGAYDRRQDDWMIVTITNKALKKIKKQAELE